MPIRLTDSLPAVARRGPILLAAAMVAGIALPDLASALRPALGPLVALLMLVSLLRLDWSELGAWMLKPVHAFWALLWQLGFAPLIAFVVGTLMALPAPMLQAFVLNGAAPSLMGSAALALLIGLDAALAVLLIVGSTLLLPLTLPPVLFWLLDIELTIDLIDFFLRFGYLIVVPFLVAGALRRLISSERLHQAKPQLDGLNIVLLVLAGIALMDGVNARLLDSPVTVLQYLGLALGFNIAFQALGALVFWRGGRRQALSFALSLGNRNMGLVLVLTSGLVGADFALYVAMAQVPMYLLPLVARPFYRRLL